MPGGSGGKGVEGGAGNEIQVGTCRQISALAQLVEDAAELIIAPGNLAGAIKAHYCGGWNAGCHEDQQCNNPSGNDNAVGSPQKGCGNRPYDPNAANQKQGMDVVSLLMIAQLVGVKTWSFSPGPPR